MQPVTDESIANWQRGARIGYGVLLLTFGLGGVWAATAPLNSAVIAPGVLAVASSRQTVQHLEGGIVREIAVRDGDLVTAGQVLFRLDPTQTEAVRATYDNQLAVARIAEARLLAERDRLDTIAWPQDVAQRAETPLIKSAMADELANFTQRRAALAADVDVIQQRRAQAQSQIEGAAQQTASLERQIASIDKELPDLRKLLKRGLTPISRVTTLERQREQFVGQLDAITTEAARNRIQITEFDAQIAAARESFQRLVAGELVETRKQISDLTERLKVASDQSRRIEITAPQTGIVQGLKVFTAGAVIRPGEPLLDIAPTNEALIVKVEIAPEDIEQVHPGLEADVRLTAFLQAGMPLIKGELTRLSNDRLVNEADRRPYFAGEVTVNLADLPAPVRDRMRAGMPASTVIATGARTVLEYLVGPLLFRMQSGMKEE